jgi:surface protein
MTLCIHAPAMGPSSTTSVRTMLATGYACVKGCAAFFFFSVFSAILTGNLLFVSAAVRQAPSSGPYYLAPNGVTVMCPGVAVGDTFDINGVTYTKVDSTTLKSLAKNSSPQLTFSCTTGITSMSYLFKKRKNFNVDISSWDTSSVTTMLSMFLVRVPPSRVLLLLLHRRVVVVTRPPSPRSKIATHSTRPPVPRRAVESQCLQSAHRCMERELGDEHAEHVLGTCSSVPRVAAALASPCRRRHPSPIPSLRDRCLLHTAARPSLRCSVPMPSISPSLIGT